MTHYEDEIYRIYQNDEGDLIVDYRSSCKYKVARNEENIIKYLCQKIIDLSDKK